MALSGSLTDFDISYIIQIIAQEKKTGRLVLESDDLEGFLVFKQGQIILAGTGSQDLQTMLFNYLLKAKKYPKKELEELKNIYLHNIRSLTQELQNKDYLTQDEIAFIAELGIEDIACTMFHWRKGNYQFTSLPNADSYQVGDFTLTADAMTMEAARRLDETQRMGKAIAKTTVFISTEKVGKEPSEAISPLDDFKEYLYSCIDGSSSVEYLCQESFFSEYRIFESLFELLQEKRIESLPDNISDPVNAAIKKTGDPLDSKNAKIFLSAIITLTIFASIIFFGYLIFKGFLFAESLSIKQHFKTELSRTRTNQKIAIATLQYQAQFGSSPDLLSDLLNTDILEKKDLANFISPTNRKNRDIGD